MFRFATPYAFLLALPLLLTVWFIYRRRVKRAMLYTAGIRLPGRLATWRTRIGVFLPLAFLAGTALTIVALARPQTVLSRTTHTSEAIAIEMVIDISGSMNALDFATRQDRHRTRLKVVKETFARFVEKRPGDLIGLVTFGGYATSRAPLTIDHNALQHVLEGVEVPKSVYEGNRVVNAEELATAIGDGLATACARLESTDVKSRIVVLLSDGASNTGIIKPAAAVQIARRLGIKVYTIGVGTTGETHALSNDAQGRPVVGRIGVQLDEAFLRRVAVETGGRYFNERDPAGLEAALEEINRLEKTEIDREIYSQYEELFPRYLIPGAGLLCLGLVLNMSVRRRLL